MDTRTGSFGSTHGGTTRLPVLAVREKKLTELYKCTQHCMHYKIHAFSIDIDGLIVNGTRRAFERSALAGTGEALRLDPSKFEIYCYGASDTLKPTPYRLMHLLIENRGQVVSRKAIYKEIWGYDFDPGTKLIEVQVHYLRGVLCRLKSVFEIKTYRGKGICLQALDQDID